MIELFTGIQTSNIVSKSIALANRARNIGFRVYTVATSPQAFAIYKTAWYTTKTVIYLSIASVLLLIDGIQAIHKWAQAHSDWQYEDFEAVAIEKIDLMAATVKQVVKGQRDRASQIVRSTMQRIERQVRLKVAEICEAVSDRALPECPGGICQVNIDEV